MKSTALPAPLRVSCAGLLSAAYVVLCTLLLVVGGGGVILSGILAGFGVHIEGLSFVSVLALGSLPCALMTFDALGVKS